MTTALSSVQDIQKAIRQGDCNNYLVKPIAQADLVTLLRSYKLIGCPRRAGAYSRDVSLKSS